jgi:outer membrane protein OmpA-like peptidoglycan-associated protein
MPAAAQDLDEGRDFSVERLRPALDSEGILDVEYGAINGKNGWNVGLWLNYARNPLVLHENASDVATWRNGGSARLGPLVENHFGAELVGSYNVLEWLQLGMSARGTLFQDRPGSINSAVEGISQDTGSLQFMGLGDLRVAAKFQLLSQADHMLDLAVMPHVTLPTGFSREYMGDTGPTFIPEVALSRAYGPLRFAANGSYTFRRPTDLDGININTEFIYRLGAAYRFDDLVGVPLEIDASFMNGMHGPRPYENEVETPAEVLAGARYGVWEDLYVFGGAGLGLYDAYGTPDWRIFGGVGWAIPGDKAAVEAAPADSDGDGILDADDACPHDAEDMDGFEDADGCPEYDNDGDGVMDADDKCPNVAGPADNQGCPKGDADTDGDGIMDSADKCPTEPEDKDGFQDEDGCPDPDNDGDGILDKDDKCPNAAGPKETQGCPSQDKDGDGVTDDSDKCPDVAGPLENAGCPDKDTDGDGVVDRLDKCPEEAGDKENNGCKTPKLVIIKQGKIEILEKILFKSGKSEILASSFDVLNDVATAIKQNDQLTKITIEGHTDSVGKDTYNKYLSQKRAESVMKYLIGKDIKASRLEAKGFGEENPIEDNKTKTGRAANRRVEFKTTTD